MRIETVAVTAILALMSGLQAAHAAVTVSISPGYTQLAGGPTLQFSANVTGSSNTAVTWQVDNANGGTPAWGTISTAGLYTMPATLPDPALVTVTAVSQADPSASATAAITLLAQAPSGTTYYVATNGNDGNSGSQAAPWLTIQHAADTVAAGDTVLVRGGVYNEHVGFSASGDSAHGIITFANYPGETAVIDGTGLDIPHGQFGLFTFADISNVVAEGFELRNYKTTKLNEVPIGIYVTGAGRGLEIVNNHIHNIETRAKTNPNQCGSDAFGLTVYGTRAPQAIQSLAIAGNEIDHLKTGCSETLSLDGNVRKFAVLNNRVHDDDNIAIGAIGFERVSHVEKYDQARDGMIRGNTVYNITSYGNPDYGRQYAADGIYVDGGRNIIIEQNLIHHSDLGIELASEHSSHVSSYVTARNNVIYAGNSAGVSIGGYGRKRGGTDHCIVINNTLYGNDTKKTGSGEFQVQYYATNNLFENNIAYATPQALMVNDFTDSSANPATVDYNLWFSDVGANKAHFVWQKTRYTGYDAWRNASGQDADSPPFSDPQFVTLGNTPDLDIQPSSPAANTGIVLDPNVVGTVDFAGSARVQNGTINIGAYEQ
ncbi:MAG TPA: right-handed parallel beta-helix repeat-containing protein [Rhizomicrobium sp.]